MVAIRNLSAAVVTLFLFKMMSGSGVVGLTDSLLSLSLSLSHSRNCCDQTLQKVILGTCLSLKRVKYSRIPNETKTYCA